MGFEAPEVIEATIIEIVEEYIDSDPAELQRELRDPLNDLHAARRYWHGS